MLPYLFLSIPVALIATATPARRLHWPLWLLVYAGLILFVGLRHHVGMDWNNYQLMIYRATSGSVADAMDITEPGYALLLRSSGELGYGIYAANLVVAVILMTGLFRYALTTPAPWLALLTALPYLVVVAGMSANRQAAAVGILLWGIAGWANYSVLARVGIVMLATMFHSSAIVFLIFIVADLHLNRAVKGVVLGLLITAALYYLALTQKFEYYDSVYGSGQNDDTNSSGAIYHVMLNGGPALLYFSVTRYWHVLLPNALHRRMALAAALLIPLSLMASAASGRLTLYLFPVSMYIVSALPLVLRGQGTKLIYRGLCSVFFVSLMLFWLLASNTGFAHLPYQNLLEITAPERELCC